MEETQAVVDACRLCDQKTEKMHRIFEKNAQGMQIINLIKEYLPIVVYRTDPLSKQVCDKCFHTLERFHDMKTMALEVSDKQSQTLMEVDSQDTKSVQLYLACKTEYKDLQDTKPSTKLRDITTHTDDLKFACSNCNSSITTNEVELCADSHQTISEGRTTRSRRKRSQAFYHELDDSICSSLTGYNTEDSQAFESNYMSEGDTVSDSEMAFPVKRRKLNPPQKCNGQIQKDLDAVKDKFVEEMEYRYNPFSLLKIALNVINKIIVPDHEYDDFDCELVRPECTYCKERFINSKLLALHEVQHMNIELGERVDRSVAWHESRDDAVVRNKWLDYYVEEMQYQDKQQKRRQEELRQLEEDEDVDMEIDTTCNDLLIPIGTELSTEEEPTEAGIGHIVLSNGVPSVRGIPLSEYTKEERRMFYTSIKIGAITKKFCRVCRYCFKDNYNIECHYFSLGCYFTCRYCGQRFNKAKHMFNDHVQEHISRGDLLSTKIYVTGRYGGSARAINTDQVQIEDETSDPAFMTKKLQTNRPKSAARRDPSPPLLQIKEEIADSDERRPYMRYSKRQSIIKAQRPNNQAYFCRKCYKVFFQLNEFNVHSQNCDNGGPAVGNRGTPSSFSGSANSNNSQPSKSSAAGDTSKNRNNSNNQNAKNTSTKMPPNNVSRNGDDQDEMLSPSGRPMRHCVKEVTTYRDEVYIPEKPIKVAPKDSQSASLPNYICYICNTEFPTVYSRNSHMRIHKRSKDPSQSGGPAKSPEKSLPPRAAAANLRTYSRYIKQEPLEPEVEIHETQQNYSQGAGSIGAVSITPISRNPNQKATINPNIMKLVQNNPHLTIRSNKTPDRDRQSGPSSGSLNRSTSPNSFNKSSTQTSPGSDSDKTYKCSSCGEPFANKSNLYFHKKNQCEGSKYPCPFCKKRFGTASAYSSHIYYNHPE